MDSRFCSLTACLKNAKNTKGQSAICEGLEKYKKNTKIQIAFLDVMEKYKKYKKKYECNCSKIQNTKNIRINNLKNTKYKKNTNPKFQKYKIQRKDKFKNKRESQPRVHFWKSGTKIQKNTKPTSCIFQTLQF